MASFCMVDGCPYQDNTPSHSINLHRYVLIYRISIEKTTDFGFSYQYFSFRFPTAKDLLSKWKKFVDKPENWQPSRLSAICSNHFALSTFKNIKNKFLRTSAVPSIKSPVVEFNVDERTAKSLERKRPREETSTRKPVFIHSSDLFPEHKVQRKIKIPREFQEEFPIGGYGNRCVKIPMEYEEDTQPAEDSKAITNGELFFTQFLQPNKNDEQPSKERCVFVYQQGQEYETMEVLADEVTTEVPEAEEYFEEVQEEVEEVQEIECYCRLCGQICEGLESFADNETILQTIHKCFPMLTIQPGDGLSSDICGTCLGTLQNFSQFSDEVISIQKQLEEKFLMKEVVVPQEEETGIKEEPQIQPVFAEADESHGDFQE